MALHYNPRITTRNLLLALDAGDVNSYPGSGAVWSDLSGNGFYADVIGSPRNITVGGAKCFYLDDIGDRFVIRFGSAQYMNSLTLEAWIYPEANELSGGDRGCIFQGWAYLSWNKGNQQLSNYWYATTNQGYHEPGVTMSRQAWHHLTSVWDRGTNTLKQYVNGTLVNTVSTYATAGYVYSDGNVGWEGDSRQFSGGISVLRVYNSALSSEEVLANYNAQKNRHGR
jgi:hypothetical protein